MSGFNTQIGGGEYHLQFETTNERHFLKIQRCARECVDGKDADPVKHGKWILVGTNEHHYETSVEEKCSLCGRYVYRYDTELQDNYCPNCGARMDGEV